MHVLHTFEPALHQIHAMKLKYGPAYYQPFLFHMHRHLLGALGNMINLKIFFLNVTWINIIPDLPSRISPNPENPMLDSLVKRMVECTFQLEAFHCVGHFDYQLLSQFLHEQRHLRRLSHSSNRKAGLVTWPACVKTIARPMLYFLRGSKNLLEAILPVGNVQMLTWETTRWEVFEGFTPEGAAQVERFAPSLSAVEYLSFEVDNTFFSLLPSYLHNLRFLQLANFSVSLSVCMHSNIKNLYY